MNYHATVVLSPKDIADLIVTAFEGGSNYWIDSVPLHEGPETTETPWYSDPAFYDGPFRIEILEQDEETPKILDPERIQIGLDLLGSQHAMTLGAILDENYDADDADVFLQLCLLGEVVYG